MDVRFEKVDAALKSLAVGLSAPPANDLERDGVIQRFEYTFELTWKVGKQTLGRMGLSAASPKAVIRLLAQSGFLADPHSWMTFLEARNYTSHTYSEATAQWVFSQCAPFLKAARALVEKLKMENADP
jgi:nucleotidyltransferase substrate binding protein (TIGR01987 family)